MWDKQIIIHLGIPPERKPNVPNFRFNSFKFHLIIDVTFGSKLGTSSSPPRGQLINQIHILHTAWAFIIPIFVSQQQTQDSKYA